MDRNSLSTLDSHVRQMKDVKFHHIVVLKRNVLWVVFVTMAKNKQTIIVTTISNVSLDVVMDINARTLNCALKLVLLIVIAKVNAVLLDTVRPLSLALREKLKETIVRKAENVKANFAFRTSALKKNPYLIVKR